jgi:hypothetical protein
METFVSDFAPGKEADEALLSFFDFLALGLGLISGPAFSIGERVSQYAFVQCFGADFESQYSRISSEIIPMLQEAWRRL